MEKGTFVENMPLLDHYSRDPKDEKYIDLAVAMRANYLVSRDRGLLDLMNDRAFRK